MSIRVAYGPKSGIESAIKSGEIPKGCLIVTNNGDNDSEYMFYSTAGDMKQIVSSGKFESEAELSQYVFANADSGRAQSDIGGRIIALLEDGVYNAYILQDSGERLSLEKEHLITSVNLSEFKIADQKLAINKIAMSKITGLPEALADKLGIKDYEERIEAVDRIAVLTLNGVELVMDGETRTVDIPLATSESLGLVTTSGKQNSIAIQDDGTMKVNNINVNKLVQTNGDTLILACGDADY